MKTIYLLSLSISFIFQSCKKDVNPEIKNITVNHNAEALNFTSDSSSSDTKVEFGIEGMICAMGCAKTIEKKIAKMNGVKFVEVNFEKGLAKVEYDNTKVTPKSLEQTITKVGKIYKVKDIKKVSTFSN